MNADQIIVEIREGLAFRGTDMNAKIVRALNRAQTEFEGATTFPWFMLVEDAELVIPAGTRTLPLPDDYAQIYEDSGPHFITTEGEAVFLVNKPFDEAYAYYANIDPGVIRAYTLRENSLYFWPEGSRDATYFWSYYAHQPIITEAMTEVDNGWLKYGAEMLIGRAGELVAGDLEDDAGVAKFKGIFARGKGWMMAKIAERESGGRPYAMGRNS